MTNPPTPAKEKIELSEARVRDLLQWHESFPLNPNGKDTKAALSELLRLRSESVRLMEMLTQTQAREHALRSTPASEGQPVAYMHRIVEPDVGQAGGLDHTLYSSSIDNPWSHWVKSHSDKCTYSCTPLYAPTASHAAPASCPECPLGAGNPCNEQCEEAATASHAARCPGCGKLFPSECDWCSRDIPRPSLTASNASGDGYGSHLERQIAQDCASNASGGRRHLSAIEREGIKRAFRKSVTVVDGPHICKRCGGPMDFLDGEWECNNVQPRTPPPDAREGQMRQLPANEREGLRRAFWKSTTVVDGPKVCKRCGGPMDNFDGEWECNNLNSPGARSDER